MSVEHFLIKVTLQINVCVSEVSIVIFRCMTKYVVTFTDSFEKPVNNSKASVTRVITVKCGLIDVTL